mmetsp:Transcript_17645/g.54956  ORF Transcript_17645/g.54956 Transcript_17645/m.54956 type:complete len:895 (-) Transcript_17645:106-2790(-)
MAGARDVYAFCLAEGTPMTVTSRHAVPHLPMQLANSFALRSSCPVMHYLAQAQRLGLVKLWRKLCAGQLPERCNKQWFFDTFCGVSPAEFAARGLSALSAKADIGKHLNGFVKPYDVVALMTVLPGVANSLGPPSLALPAGGGKQRHALRLSAQDQVSPDLVISILRECYHAVVEHTGASLVGARQGPSRGHSPLAKLVTHAEEVDRRPSAWRHRPFASRHDDARHALAARGAMRQTSWIGWRLGIGATSARPRAVPVVPASPHLCTVSWESPGLLQRHLEGAIAAALVRQRELTQAIGLAVIAILLGFVIWQVAIAYESDRVGPAMAVAAGDRASGFASVLMCGAFLMLQPHEAQLPQARTAFVLLAAVILLANVAILVDFAAMGSLTGRSEKGRASMGSMARAVAFSNLAVSLALVPSVLVVCVRAFSVWHDPRALLNTLWLIFGILNLVMCAYSACVAALFGLAAMRASTPTPALALQDLWAAAGWECAALTVHACVLPLCQSMGTRSIVRARLALSVALPGPTSALAPLLGLGTLQGPEHVPSLIAAARRSFHPRPLHPDAFAALRDGRLAQLPHWASPSAALLASLADERTQFQLLSHRREPVVSTSDSPSGGVGPCATPSPADVYVVHSSADEAGARVVALEEWSTAFEREHGRRPVAVMDALSGDPSLDGRECLSHGVVHLAHCARLLVLIGPQMADDLKAVSEIVAWAALGHTRAHGSALRVTEVEVALAADDDGAVRAALAAVDTFHVFNLLRRANPASDSRSDRGMDNFAVDHVASYALALELADFSFVNGVVHSLVPHVQEAMKRAGNLIQPKDPYSIPRSSSDSFCSRSDESMASRWGDGRTPQHTTPWPRSPDNQSDSHNLPAAEGRKTLGTTPSSHFVML